MSPLAIRAQQTDCVADTQGPQCRTGDHYEVSLVADGKVGNRSGQHGIFRQCRFAGQHDGISVVWNCIQGGVTLTEQVLRRSSDSKKTLTLIGSAIRLSKVPTTLRMEFSISTALEAVVIELSNDGMIVNALLTLLASASHPRTVITRNDVRRTRRYHLFSVHVTTVLGQRGR